MIYKEHSIELYVNKKLLELESQNSLNLRFNDVLFNPEEITSTVASYSFEFEIPSTPNNDKVFDYANNLSKIGKFRKRWNAEVYADGKLIFEGSLVINSYKEKKYTCNLVEVKNYSLEDIFGEQTLNQIEWYKPFEGGESINDYNGSGDTEVMFPLVSYGVFEKDPKTVDDIADEYTSKFDIDEYNRWYVESFAPSMNMLNTVKKAFEWKGYVVQGNAFTDEFLKDIYMSTNLADNQTPDYNLGNPKFGSIDLTATITASTLGYQQQLSFPYYRVTNTYANSEGTFTDSEYNWSAINIHDILSEGTVTLNQEVSYMYQPNENIIVIPSDGFYKIDMKVSSTLNTTGKITAKQYLVNMINREMYEQDIEMTAGFNEITPLEVHLVRNYSDNLELIKGKNNRTYANGNPNDQYYYIGSSESARRENITEWLTCFPHEDPYNVVLPTEPNSLTSRSINGNRGGLRGSHVGTTRSTSDDTSAARTRGGTIDRNQERNYSPATYGFVYKDGKPHCYDQAVSDAFICGFSSMSNGGIVSVMKNGYSWTPASSLKNEVFADVTGYAMAKREAGSGNLIMEDTDHNYNTYLNSPNNYVLVSNTSMNGSLSQIVWLNKNDILSLKTVHRAYETTVGNNVLYTTTTKVDLKIQAYSKRSFNILKAQNKNDYTAPTEFDVDLRLSNFLNEETLISDFIQGVVDAFNLELTQNGNVITIDKRFKTSRPMAAVELDNRVNTNEAESSMIEYPKSMALKYKIDKDEWGFERSAVNSQGGDESILNDDDWVKYGDSGYTIIELNDDTYVTNTSDKELIFSYCWYDNFNFYNVDKDDKKTSDTPITLSIPVISKYSYMIDGYSYEESMKHDGFGQTLRLWFKPKNTGESVWLDSYPVEQVYLYLPSNLWTNYKDKYLNLSYKVNEKSIINQYFGITPYLASNYVTVEVYLTPEEYSMLKSGALAHFDSDLYRVVEIEGYDVTGYNKTKLKLMKIV